MAGNTTPTLPQCWRRSCRQHALFAQCKFVQPVAISLSGNARCEANATRVYPEGDITVEIEWPATAVGLRRIVRCPYAYGRPSYAHRDCTLHLADLTPRWSAANATSCPYPLFSSGVDRLASFLVSTRSPRCRVQPWASCLHAHVPLSPSSI